MTRAEILQSMRAAVRAERAAMRRERLVEFFGRPAARPQRKRAGPRGPNARVSVGPAPGRCWLMAQDRAVALIGRLSVAEACTAAILEHVRSRFSGPAELPELVMRLARDVAAMPPVTGRVRHAIGRARRALPAPEPDLPMVVVDTLEPDGYRAAVASVLTRSTSMGQRGTPAPRPRQRRKPRLSRTP